MQPSSCRVLLLFLFRNYGGRVLGSCRRFATTSCREPAFRERDESAREQERAIGPENREEPEGRSEPAENDGHRDLRELVRGEPQAEGLARAPRWRVVVGEEDRERLRAAQADADHERREPEERGL